MVNGNTDLILDFVNTLDLRPYKEALDSPAALGDWLAGHGLLGAESLRQPMGRWIATISPACSVAKNL